jgi:hypothetical protein
MNVFSHETLCNLVENSSVLMQAVHFSEMLLHIYHITWHHVLENSNKKRYIKLTLLYIEYTISCFSCIFIYFNMQMLFARKLSDEKLHQCKSTWCMSSINSWLRPASYAISSHNSCRAMPYKGDIT